MKFHYRKVGDDFYETCLLNDENEVLFHLQVPENSIKAWLIGFVKMMDTIKERGQCQRLVKQASHLCKCEYKDSYTFLTVMSALLTFLDNREKAPADGRQAAQQELYKLLKLNEGFNFHASHEKINKYLTTYRFGVIVDGKIFKYERREDAGQPCVTQAWWTHAIRDLREKSSEGLHEILLNYQLLREIIVQQTRHVEYSEATRDFNLRSFASLSKALIDFIRQDQSGDFLKFRANRVLDLCTFIVENKHDSFEEQKPYLERVLASDETPEKKVKRLRRIVKNVKMPKREPAARRMNDPRLMAIIGTISEYFLSLYDLNHATEFWDLLDNKDWLLRRLLGLYRSPERYVKVVAFFWLTMTALTILSGNWQANEAPQLIISWLAQGLLALFFVPLLIGLLFTVGRFLTLRGLDYVALFLPNLLGAIAVGLSVLLLQDTAWKISLQLEWFNFGLICVVVYVLSFVYIFTDVHRTLRLLPLQPAADQYAVAGQPTAWWPDWLARFQPDPDNPMNHLIKISVQVFLIGLLEAFAAVLFTSVILAVAALSPDFIEKFDGLKLVWRREGIYCFAFFPQLVLLWTGLTLFIGAFVQLLWQDRRITSPL